MNFHHARADKFKKGALAHPDQSWDTLDPISELKDELLDMYNYAEHKNFPKGLGAEIQVYAVHLWTILEDIQNENNTR